jgi:LemA protein
MEYIGFILLGLVVVIAIWLVTAYNSLVSLRNRVDEAFSTMDVYMVKRYDLIPNLVETVKGYAKHESETLEKVIAARNMAAGSKTLEEKATNEASFQGALGRLFAIAEAYPDLKANASFLDLQSQLKAVEDDIAQSRKYYNGSTREFNTTLERFPTNLVAGMFGFKRRPLFEVTDEAQRQNVKVQF